MQCSFMTSPQRALFEDHMGYALADDPPNLIDAPDVLFSQIRLHNRNKRRWTNTHFWADRDGMMAHQVVLGYRIGD